VRLPDSDLARGRAKILELIAFLEIVEVDAVVLNRAALPMPTALGTLDALHLATALLWTETTDSSLTMATHDEALAMAVAAHGLPVVGAKRT
jgi:predicted nucleic acid-binding protein